MSRDNRGVQYSMRIGAHVSISGGYDRAVYKARDMGCTAVQIFSAAPHAWNRANPDDQEINLFQNAITQTGIEDVVFHATYLVNFADEGRIGHASRDTIASELRLAERMGIQGTIIHLGSFKHKEDTLPFEIMPDRHETLISNIKKTLAESPQDRWFIAENAGNRKIGKSIDELARIVADVDDRRLKICLDTCHLHAAGYDLRSAGALDTFVSDFDSKIGLDRLAVIHVNDSRDPFGALRDRHENIGHGSIGTEPFRLLVNHPKLRDALFILEVPGFDKTGPDKANVDIIKGLISRHPREGEDPVSWIPGSDSVENAR